METPKTHPFVLVLCIAVAVVSAFTVGHSLGKQPFAAPSAPAATSPACICSCVSSQTPPTIEVKAP